MSGKDKENVPLQPAQASLSLPAGAPSKSQSSTATRGSRGTLAVKKDLEINLHDENVPVTKEVVDAMRKRILELEEQLDGQDSAKRRKTSTASADNKPKARPRNTAAAEPSSSSSTPSAKKPVDQKKVDAIIKKIWSSLQREVKTERHKFKGGPPKVCRIEEVIEEDEWVEIFFHRPGQARVVQPLPENKPNSSVWITLYPEEDIEKIFGKHYKELKGNRYSLGGICARYAKGEKIGLVSLDIISLHVTYSMKSMKCGMKFEVEETYPYRCGLDDEY